MKASIAEANYGDGDPGGQCKGIRDARIAGDTCGEAIMQRSQKYRQNPIVAPDRL